MQILIFPALILIAVLWRRQNEFQRETEQEIAWLRADSRRHNDAMAALLGRSEPPPSPPPIPVPVKKPAPPPVPEEPEKPNEPEAPVGVKEASPGWEALIGGNLLNKLGALIMVIGIALFLSHSFTRMGPGGRAATGVVIGAAILAGGLRLERIERYHVFSRGLIAAGWAALYFTSYAMSAIPATQVIENPVLGVMLMASVAVGMVAHSLRYKVESLTALAFGCVFAALALSDLNGLTSVALVPLTVSMLYLSNRFGWNALALLSAGATYATFLSRESTGAPLASVQGMLLVYWLLFEAADILRIRSGRSEGRFGPSLTVLNALAGLGASAAIWNRMALASDIWQYCAASAALYLLSTAIRFRLGAAGQTRCEFALAASALMAGLAIFAHVPGIWVSVGMMVEAEALLLAGLALGLGWARPLSLIAFAAAATQITSSPELALLAAVFYGNRYLAREARYFGYAASAMTAILIGREAPWRFAGVGWLLFGVALFELGVARGLADFRVQSYALTLLGACGAVSPWTYGTALAVSLWRAIRATTSLAALPEAERDPLRLSGAVGTALMAGLLAVELIPRDFLGLALLLAAAVLVELAVRGLPGELAIPATVLGAAGLGQIAYHQPGGSASYSAGAAACFLLTWRLRAVETAALQPARQSAPWAASVLAMAALWLVLPEWAAPVAWGLLALAVIEVRIAPAAGTVVALAAAAAALDIETGRLANSAAIAALHWRLAQRQQALHNWVAMAVVMVASAVDLPFDYLLVWSVLGIGLASVPPPASQKWQTAVVAAGAMCASVVMGAATSFWHHGAVALALLIALTRPGAGELRPAYSIGAGLVIAAALYRDVSGGLLTLSWSAEAIVLLAAGLLLRERALRLSGLALLLGCIGKAFLYDLRNLETPYRILSFVGLGAILLIVSAGYTRFKDSLQKHL